ncbi:Spy/CpxP family protein refolding chaperone [Marinobacter sediminum]|uniref:Spy/CpxP family protein refolding chaperone n=1 Tax=Marinobacter sediminum TaxID=256323 RepID=UPI0035644DD9
MKQHKNSRIWVSLALSLGLSSVALTASAHPSDADAASSSSAAGPDTSQPGRDNAAGRHHHNPHYQGHHGKSGHSGHHGMNAQGEMHHGMSGYEGMRRGPMMELGLDDDQLEEIAEIEKELRSELSELKVERYKESLKLQELYAADELEADDIVDQQQRVFDVIKEITELQVEAQQDIRHLLTTEQKNKLLRSGGWLMSN